MMGVQQQNPDGSWTDAQAIGWLEEHPRWVCAIYRLLGISHCNRRGWRQG